MSVRTGRKASEECISKQVSSGFGLARDPLKAGDHTPQDRPTEGDGGGLVTSSCPLWSPFLWSPFPLLLCGFIILITLTRLPGGKETICVVSEPGVSNPP